jgi:predicted metalloprotease
VAGNALYNPTLRRHRLRPVAAQDLSEAHGDSLPAVVLAHEFGHAVQARVGSAAGGRSIHDETQADCFAGAWTAWVNDGEARHVAIDERDLDGVLRGYLLLRDPVGSDPDNSQAHGSYFDRVSAFSEGHDGGVASCRDDFGPDRLFTAQTFAQDELANRGNAAYGATLQIVDGTLPPFWRDVFRTAFGREFDEPTIRPLDRSPPPCGERGTEELDLAFCEADSTVYYDETELVLPAYQQLGDFAVATAISLPYSLAARSELGLSTDDEASHPLGGLPHRLVCGPGLQRRRRRHRSGPDQPRRHRRGRDVPVDLRALGPRVPQRRRVRVRTAPRLPNGFLRGGGPCDVGLR